MNSQERLNTALLHCERIRHELLFSYGWISKEIINEQWVENLQSDEMKKERVSAFCARFGKFQDYFSDKVLRLWLEAVGEYVGTALENFSVAERVGILSIPSEQMVELRTIRNRLTHEYIENEKAFSADVNAVILMTPVLLAALDKLVSHYQAVMRKA
ncbi:MAG: hypothetical protein Q8O24_00295 [Gallionellaceae bacterium]|nr:hypothetical protein [Gallionellaceae bacterium]